MSAPYEMHAVVKAEQRPDPGQSLQEVWTWTCFGWVAAPALYACRQRAGEGAR